MLFTLVAHRDVFARNKAEGKGEEGPDAPWRLAIALAVLVAATLAIVGCAEFVSGAISAAATTLHLPLLFMGVVPLALIGTAADLFAAVSFARQDRMGLVPSICIGLPIQVVLGSVPLLVPINAALGQPMTLVFPSILNLVAIASAAFVTRLIAADGEMNRFDGLLLTGVYVLLALGF